MTPSASIPFQNDSQMLAIALTISKPNSMIFQRSRGASLKRHYDDNPPVGVLLVRRRFIIAASSIIITFSTSFDCVAARAATAKPKPRYTQTPTAAKPASKYFIGKSLFYKINSMRKYFVFLILICCSRIRIVLF